MPLIPDQPLMSEAEIELLKKWLPKGARVLEFGAGSSSKFFFSRSASLLASVESDLAYLKSLARDDKVSLFYTRNKWLPLHANIGKTRDYGYPQESRNVLRARNYHQAIWEKLTTFFPPRGQKTAKLDLDFVLVDGRFRVACLCQTLIHCRTQELPIFFHDFRDRPFYHPVLEFTEVQDQADTAVLLFPRNDLNFDKLKEFLRNYSFDPR